MDNNLNLRSTYCSVDTIVRIIPSCCCVIIQKQNDQKHEAFDFSGKSIALEKHFRRFDAGKYKGAQVDFKREDYILEVNYNFCKESDYGKEIYLNFGDIHKPLPFAPVYSCEGYTLGKYNNDIAQRLSLLLNATAPELKTTWSRIEVHDNGTFDVFGGDT